MEEKDCPICYDQVSSYNKVDLLCGHAYCLECGYTLYKNYRLLPYIKCCYCTNNTDILESPIQMLYFFVWNIFNLSNIIQFIQMLMYILYPIFQISAIVHSHSRMNTYFTFYTLYNSYLAMLSLIMYNIYIILPRDTLSIHFIKLFVSACALYALLIHSVISYDYLLLGSVTQDVFVSSIIINAVVVIFHIHVQVHTL